MVNRRIPLFWQLEIETFSTCNRTCEGCIRNSHPDRDAVAPWFVPKELPFETVARLLREAQQIGFGGNVCFQHYNEPLQDSRIPEFGVLAKSMGFSHVYICSNGDYMNEARAAELDGVFDEIVVALYVDEPQKSKREALIRTLFKKTRLSFTGGAFIATHFSPTFPVESLARRHSGHPCHEPLRRMIVNHRGDMLMCCDDMIGHFELGNVADHSIEELWFSERHQDMVLALQEPGGRSVHPHCLSCPRA